MGFKTSVLRAAGLVVSFKDEILQYNYIYNFISLSLLASVQRSPVYDVKLK